MNDVLGLFSPEAEVYPIDETFLDLSGFGERTCGPARRTCAGLCGAGPASRPASVSGPTRTLAKLAAVLRAFPVRNVWGVERATAPRLAEVGVATAGGLRDLDLMLARQTGTVVLERMVTELRGVRRLDLEHVAPTRKGMAVTRSFGHPLTAASPARRRASSSTTCAGPGTRRGASSTRRGSAPRR